MNTVREILTFDFSTIASEEKMKIKNKFRPSPDLNIVQIKKSETGDYAKKLSYDIYKNT